MLQPMESQRVGHDYVTEQQKIGGINSSTKREVYSNINLLQETRKISIKQFKYI